MAPIKFGDIGKLANDLLNNDYCFARKLKLSTKTLGGVSFTTEGTMKSKGTSGKITLKGKGPLDGVNIDKACVDTSGRLTLESTLSNAVPNTTFTVKASDGADKAPAGELSLNYKTGSVNVNVAADVVEGPTLKADATAVYEGFTVGGSVKYNTAFDSSDAGASLDDYNAGLSYAMQDMTVSFGTKKKISVFSLGLHHQVNSNLAVAAVVGFDSKSTGKSITLGAKKAVAGGAVTGKVDSNGLVSANYIQSLSAGVKLITSAQVDATNFAGDSHKFGLTLNLTP